MGPFQGNEECLDAGAAGEVVTARHLQVPRFLALVRRETRQDLDRSRIVQWEERQLLFGVEFGDKTCHGTKEPSAIGEYENWARRRGQWAGPGLILAGWPPRGRYSGSRPRALRIPAVGPLPVGGFEPICGSAGGTQLTDGLVGKGAVSTPAVSDDVGPIG